jgi:hypothetical protein
VDLWKTRYQAARREYEKHQKRFKPAKELNDLTFVANAQGEMNAAKNVLDALSTFQNLVAEFVARQSTWNGLGCRN